MVRSKLVSLVVSFITLAVFALVMVKGIALFERRAAEASRALLEVGADHVELALARQGAGLPEAAASFASDLELAQGLRLLTTQLTTIAALPRPPERFKALAAAQQKKVADRVTALRADLGTRDVDGLMVIDEQGLVIASDAPALAAGSRLTLPPLSPTANGSGADGAVAPEGEDAGTRGPGGPGAPKREPRGAPLSPQGFHDDGGERGVRHALWVPAGPNSVRTALYQDEGVEAGEPRGAGRAPSKAAPAQGGAPAAEPSAPADAASDAPAPPPGPLPPLAELAVAAMRSGQREGHLVADGQLVYVGAAPIFFKGKVAGAVVTERRLRALPQPSGVDAFLMIDGKVVLGKAPDGFVQRTSFPDSPSLLAQRSALAQVPYVGVVPVAPLFVDPADVGVWAQRFSVPGVKQASGFVFADVTPIFVQLGGFQVIAMAIALVIFLVHALMIVLLGRRLTGGVNRMADFLGRHQQGLPGDSKINERQYPASLHRLARLINKSIERSTPAFPGGAPPAKPPSLDEVIQAQAVSEPPPDLGELDFEGITNAGSLAAHADVPVGRSAPPAAPPSVSAVVAAAAPSAPAASAAPSGKPVAPASAAPQRRPTVPIDEDGFESISGEADAIVGAGDTPAGELPDFGAAGDALDGLVSRTVGGPAEPGRGATLELRPAAPAATILPSPTTLRPKPSDEVVRPPTGAAAAELLAQLAQRSQAASPPGMEKLAESTPAPPAPAPPGGELMDAFVFGEDAPPNDEEREAHWRDVFRQFAEVRRECGESTAELTYEKFTVKLQQSREAVMAKHACSDVRFQVYVKNGRAALKATPR